MEFYYSFLLLPVVIEKEVFMGTCRNSTLKFPLTFPKWIWPAGTDPSQDLVDLLFQWRTETRQRSRSSTFVMKWLNLTFSKDSLEKFSHRFPSENLPSATG